MSYENRCPVCGENRQEHVFVKEQIAHCQICGYRYRLVEVDTEIDWEELMGARESA